MGTVTASDGDGLTYSLASGGDNDSFTIDDTITVTDVAVRRPPPPSR